MPNSNLNTRRQFN